jgi:hypothetical protein
MSVPDLSGKNYKIEETSGTQFLAKIMQDYAYNMKRLNGEDYKEGCVKTIWNVTAKMLQEKFNAEYNRIIDPFGDIIFQGARAARDTKRKELQARPEKRKENATALTDVEQKNIISLWDEDTPVGLQRKFYHIASVELTWRGGEAFKCLTSYFKQEINNDGSLTGNLSFIIYQSCVNFYFISHFV